jgi:hypothetical protein
MYLVHIILDTKLFSWMIWKYNNIIFCVKYLKMRIVDAHNSQPTFRAFIMDDFPEEPVCISDT